MTYVKPYPAISRYDIGTYGWAMDQVAARNDMRRENWPIEVVPAYEPDHDPISRPVEMITRIWKVYKTSEGGICKGFSNGVVGADNDSWGSLGTDSGGYYPSDDDKSAKDWQFTSDVTPEQIKRLNANRMTRHPNAYLQEYFESERTGNRKIGLSIMLIVIVFGLAWHFSP